MPDSNKKPKWSYLRFAAGMPNETRHSDFTHYRFGASRIAGWPKSISPSVFFDTTYCQARVNRWEVSQAVVIATRVTADGHESAGRRRRRLLARTSLTCLLAASAPS
jgi:Transposase, Mutator family